MKFAVPAVLALFAGLATSAASAQTVPPDVTAAGRVVVDLWVSAVTTGNLPLETTNRGQQIEIEVGPLPGEVTVFGIPAIPSGFTFPNVSNLSLRTGLAQDFVEVRFLGDTAPDTTINTGAGNSDVVLRYFTPAAAQSASNVRIIGGAGNDKATIEVISEADTFAANWIVEQGNGNNEVFATVQSTAASTSLSASLTQLGGTGIDIANFNVISAASALNLAFNANQGRGNDSAIVTIDGLGPATTTLALDILQGDGADVTEALAVTRGGTTAFSGRVLGENGIDTIKTLLEGDGSTSLLLDGGASADVIESEYKGAVTGAPRLNGGTGNDVLKIVADQPALLAPTLDGGLGFDIGIGFGTFISVESIN
jgi:hypothetical protein